MALACRAEEPSTASQAEMRPNALFNDGDGAYNQFGGYLNPQVFGRLEIDNKFKPLRLRVGYVARISSS